MAEGQEQEKITSSPQPWFWMSGGETWDEFSKRTGVIYEDWMAAPYWAKPSESGL